MARSCRRANRTISQRRRSAPRRRSTWGGRSTRTVCATCCTRTPSTRGGPTWRVAACPARTARLSVPRASAPRSTSSATSPAARRSGGGCGTPASPPTSPTSTVAASAPRCSLATASGPRTSSLRGWTSSARRDASAAVAASPGARPQSISRQRSPPSAQERTDMRTIEQYLPDHPFFEGLDEPTLALVAGCATNISLAAGEYLCHEGDSADQFFVVRRGRVAIEVHGPAAGTLVLDTADEGDVVGWSWLVPPVSYTHLTLPTILRV